jgi:signal transduction histidine kinase
VTLVDSEVSVVCWDDRTRVDAQDVSVRDAVGRTEAALVLAAADNGVRYDSQKNGIAPSLIVRADPTGLSDILLQLMMNALKFSQPKDAIFVRAMAVGNRVWIRVSDTGIAIAERGLGPAFQPFARRLSDHMRLNDAAALWLANTHQLARAMGGELSVRAKGPGATFTLVLPRGRHE